MTTYYFWLFLFSMIVYFIASDNSIAKAVDFGFKLIQFELEKTKWWLLHNPNNFIIRWTIHKRSLKMAKKLMAEFKR